MHKYLIPIFIFSLSCSSELTDISRQDGTSDVALADVTPDVVESTDTRKERDVNVDVKTADMSADISEDIVVIEDMKPDLPEPDCDYEFVDGKLVIEAESLPLVDDWKVESVDAGFTGTGYLVWRGASSNGDPSNGQIAIKIRIPAAGRYKFQWHTRVGTGNNATEHNDSWITFADAADYFGLKRNSSPESRRYPKPQCDDAQFIADKTASAEVGDARCAAGSSSGGWMKVYSSGALDWKWSTFTSDSDGSEIFVEYDAPGVYTLGLAARGDSHQIDRMVLTSAAVDDAGARDLANAETKCN